MTGPYRRIYSEGLILGERINGVSVEAEAAFVRINAVADDLGNLRYGSGRIVWAQAAPMRPELMDRFGDLIEELIEARLLTEYEVEGKTYLHIDGFEDRQKSRNGRPFRRVPEMPGESGGIRGNPGESGAIQGKPHGSGAIRLDQIRTPPKPPPSGGAKKKRSRRLSRQELAEAAAARTNHTPTEAP